jgi:GNAT superfamily N-acetyltransferase
MKISGLQFKPIELEKHLEDAIRFREDSFICSFGDASRFKRDEYVGWLKDRAASDPWAAVHVWQDQQMIGQMALSPFIPDPSVGYVNLYYLVPEMRGKGVSAQLDEYAMSYLKGRGHLRAFLSVSLTNMRAISYYLRLGWIDRGSPSHSPELILMEKQIP